MSPEEYVDLAHARLARNGYDPQTGAYQVAYKLWSRPVLRSHVERVWGLDAKPLPVVPSNHAIFAVLATIDGEQRVVRVHHFPSVASGTDDTLADTDYAKHMTA